MFVVIGILFFIAWLASYFFRANLSIDVSYILLGLTILSFIIHFVVRGRHSPRKGQI